MAISQERESEAEVEHEGTHCEKGSGFSQFSSQGHQDMEKQRDTEVLNLARAITTQSERSHHQSPFTSESESLNPGSPKFNAHKWAKAFYNIRYNSVSDVNPRVAGFAFRNLNVWGKGTPTDFQASVANSILKLPSIFGKGSRKIDILRDIDGLLLPGEQLCVLGPPG